MGSLLSCARSTSAGKPKGFNDQFQLGPELGKGHFATVNICTAKKTGDKFAVKIINKRKVTNPMAMREEVAVLRRVGKHRHCVELISVHEDDNNFFLIMELCTGGDLFSRIVDYGNYSEKDAGRTLQQLALALDHIHKQGVTHRDLKPENILLVSNMADSDLKVGDFGLSKILDGDQVIMKTICGTWAYCAPEVIEQKPYTSLVDNWTLGVLMFILLSGYHPFDDYGDLPEPELLERIVNCEYNFEDPVWNDISEPPKQIIRSLLKLDPPQRMSLEVFLAHPWINGGIANAAPLTGTITRMQSFNSGRKGKTGLVSQYSTTMMDAEPSLDSKANFATTIAKKRISESVAEEEGDSQAGADEVSVNAETSKANLDGQIPGAGTTHTVQFGDANIIADPPNLQIEQEQDSV